MHSTDHIEPSICGRRTSDVSSRRTLVSPGAALWFAVMVAVGAAPAAGGVPIGDLHQNDAQGLPAAPYTIGTSIQVTGIVTVPDSTFNLFSTAVYVQDATGGIYIFQSGGVFSYHFELGDSVTVSGRVAQFEGITEVSNLTDVEVHSGGNAVPEPTVLTCADIPATFDPITFREDHESRLVKIASVSITAGSWPTSPGGNTSLTISDGSGSCELLIAQHSELNGSPAPPAIFDITGVIQQADATAPHDSMYRLVPRFLGDVGGQGPQITSGPTIVDLTPTSVRVDWTTATPATSVLEIGPTTTYGLTFSDPTLVTQHSITADPIPDASWHHFRVQSADGQGTALSPDGTFMTAPATDEALMAFFNQDIDSSLAAGKVAAGNVPLDAILIAYIDGAQHSVDAAFYSLSLPQVADALIAAHNRGLEVRVIKDAGTSAFQYNRLVSAGVPAILSNFAGPHSGIHHNKYWVVDARESSSTLDDVVITGSWNPTFQGTADDAQNIVVLHDTDVAEAFTLEFDEMWGSSTTIPNAANSRFGSDKFNNTDHQFEVNGIPVEVYFAPSDNHENITLLWINNAHTSIYFSILTFTRDIIQTTMRNRRDAVPGLEVRGVFDDGYDQFSEYPTMAGTGPNPWVPPADVHLGDYAPGFLHHKTMILDSNDATSDPMVITGSANWSTAARNSNDENQVHIHDFQLARQYLQEFAVVYTTAGGSATLGQSTGIAEPAAAGGVTPAGFGLRAAPNPFNPRTVLRFDLEDGAPDVRLRIANAYGRSVRTFRLGNLTNAGRYEVEWDGRNDHGESLPSGVYFAALSAGGAVDSERLVLLK